MFASKTVVPGKCVATEAVSSQTFQQLWKTNPKMSGTICLVIACSVCPVSFNCKLAKLAKQTRLLSSAVLPDHPEAGLEDERCPLMTGCDRAGGQCVCDARHSCLGSFTYPDQETCMKASKSGEALSVHHARISSRCTRTHKDNIQVSGNNAVH